MTRSNDNNKPVEGRMSWRTVEDRERRYPHLSIVYRVWAQQEIWVLHDGRLHDYFDDFESGLQIPELGERTKESQFVEADSAWSLVDKVVNELTWDGNVKLDADERVHLPYLTQLYRAVVLDDNEVHLDPVYKEEIENQMLAELLGMKLFW
jgi:hypothetical protein